jgi:hypothetical protein
VAKKSKDRVILAVSDIQAPFQHVDALDFLAAVKKKYRPDVHVNMGDECDFHALSDYDTDPDGYSPGNELEKALEFMRSYYDLFPEAKVCISNHTVRPLKRAFKAGIPRAFLRTYHEFLEAPKGWQWADKWEVDGIIFEHGESFGGENAHIKHALANMKSTVIGHHHSIAGVTYYANEDTIIFGMGTGSLIDVTQYAFAYGRKLKKKPIIGLGIIVGGTPRYIPMVLKSNGRWDRIVR